MKEYKILAINPGSTSTKVAVFLNDRMLVRETVVHDAHILATFEHVSDQLEYRKETILNILKEKNIRIDDCDAFVGRGGGLVSCRGGVYEVNDVMLAHASSGKFGGDHPAALGSQIAWQFAGQFHGRAFIVNGPDTDEFCDEARITGLSDVYRSSHIHALNQKETARIAANEMGLDYQKSNFIVAHIGGGVSITAHRQGLMVDSNDIINGDGPMAPTRSGALPAKEFMDLCYSGRWSRDEMYKRLTKSGGFVDHLGTSEMLDVIKMIQEGNRYAELIYQSFIYQIVKNIGAMAAVLHGKVNAIIVTGGIAHDEQVIAKLWEMVGFIATVKVYPGEFEMEALAAGALRALTGEEQVEIYTGKPVFTDFEYLKAR